MIESLNDDLESKEKFIEMLEKDIKDNARRNALNKKTLEAKNQSLEEELAEKMKIIDALENNSNFKCSKGCDKYSKSVDEIFEAGVKHKSKLVDLKEIAEQQKEKITCLRKHRDEIKEELNKLEDVHEDKMKHNSEKIGQLTDQVTELMKENKDQKDEINLKNKEIEELMIKNENKDSINSLADEMCYARSQPTLIASENPLNKELAEVEILSCDQCASNFRSETDLKVHIDETHEALLSQKLALLSKLSLLERELSGQKVKLTSSLISLKNQEIKQRKVCCCRIDQQKHIFCKINHKKYNYEQSKSEKILSKLENISEDLNFNFSYQKESFQFGAIRKRYSCNKCAKEFNKQGDLKKHKKKEHRSKGEKIGEV